MRSFFSVQGITSFFVSTLFQVKSRTLYTFTYGKNTNFIPWNLLSNSVTREMMLWLSTRRRFWQIFLFLFSCFFSLRLIVSERFLVPAFSVIKG